MGKGRRGGVRIGGDQRKIYRSMAIIKNNKNKLINKNTWKKQILVLMQYICL